MMLLRDIVTVAVKKALVQEGVYPDANSLKKDLEKANIIPTMWQIEESLKKEGYLNDKLALSFFCPVYFSGQQMVKKFLDVQDENGEMVVFKLPAITDEARIQTGLNQMKLLGIKNPEGHLVPSKKGKGKKALPTFSSLPGIEGVGSGHVYEYIGWEAVMIGAFSIVPKHWLNAGVPYDESYRFPGEDGYSPYWRVPSLEELKSIRPDLAKGYKKTNKGIIKTDFMK